MPITTLLFIFLSLLAVGGAVMMLISKNPVHSILWLIVVFFAISGHYVLLNAQFLAIVNIIVYAGAIMVLFLFVVMLMNLNADTEPVKNYRLQLIGVIAGGSLLLVILSAVMRIDIENLVQLKTGEAGLINNLGMTLFTNYVLPFEVSSILFLSAIVGAVVLGKKN
ncbi:MAG: NADH-quinone oxidoreductase subunit J [Ferruginibacter sp.]